jgi:transcriptional regulator with XRE-family HTH domain
MKNVYNIGPELKGIRTSRKITINDASKKIGITGHYLRLIENNKKLPTIPMLAKICDCYKIGLWELFKLCGGPEQKEPVGNYEEFAKLEKEYSNYLE